MRLKKRAPYTSLNNVYVMQVNLFLLQIKFRMKRFRTFLIHSYSKNGHFKIIEHMKIGHAGI